MKKLHLALAILALLASCKKDSPVDNSTGRYLLSVRHYFSDQTYFDQNFSYNGNDQFAKIEYVGQNGARLSTEQMYYNNTNGRLDSIVTTDDAPVNKNYFTYQNGQLVGMRHDERDSITHKLELYYNRSFEYYNDVLLKTSDINAKDNYNTYTIYTYINHNVTETKIYLTATNELLEDTRFEYDSKNNPYYTGVSYNLHNPFNNKNNVVLEKYVYRKNQQPGQVKYQYNYNNQDYPVKQFIVASNNNLILQQEFRYN